MIHDFNEEYNAPRSEYEELFLKRYSEAEDYVNKHLIIFDCKPIMTNNGLRIAVAYKNEDDCMHEGGVFVTGSKHLKETLERCVGEFPFRAIIKPIRYGEMIGFKFFSPQSEITSEDKDLFREFVKYQNRRNYERR